MDNAAPDDGGDILAGRLIELMKGSGIPNGLAGIGYTPAQIPELAAVTGALKRQLSMSPRPGTEADLHGLLPDALQYWG